MIGGKLTALFPLSFIGGNVTFPSSRIIRVEGAGYCVFSFTFAYNTINSSDNLSAMSPTIEGFACTMSKMRGSNGFEGVQRLGGTRGVGMCGFVCVVREWFSLSRAKVLGPQDLPATAQRLHAWSSLVKRH